MKYNISGRAQQLSSSAIREILKVTEDPEVISFAGGLPSHETFPIELIKGAAEKILFSSPESALQYAPTDGFRALREWIGTKHGVDAERVIITSGSQQGLDLIAKLLIEPGQTVLLENPTYLGALQAFSLYSPIFRSLECDQSGIIADAIDCKIAGGISFLYTMPNFQNPTGRRMTYERRMDVLSKLQGSNIIVVEDDPYGELYFNGNPIPSMLSLDPDRVIYLGSFSKIIAPGLRVGYIVAPKDLIGKLIQIKQASDLHTSEFSQRIIYEVIKDDFLGNHVGKIRSLYLERRNSMMAALGNHCSEVMTWNTPDGGMFLWARSKSISSERLLSLSLNRENGPRVAFVPGRHFFMGHPDDYALRLSFVTVAPPHIERGIAHLGSLLKASC